MSPEAQTPDVLSDVLRTVRLRGAAFYYMSGNRRWVAEAPGSRDIAPAVMPQSEHVMEYHVVVTGSCWAALIGEPPVRLTAGDVVMFPQGDAHVISSAPGMRADPNVQWYFDTPIDRLPLAIKLEGTTPFGVEPPAEAAETTLVCGFLGCDLRPFNPLIAALPRILHLPSEPNGWITSFVTQAVGESAGRQAGSEAMLARMSEMMFVDAVRRFVQTLPEGSTGWLSGLQDPFVGRALGAIHRRPDVEWTVESLGREAGLSRSALHQRFVELVGQPPIEYVAQWRMQVASGLLLASTASVASIALDVGYQSEAAFSRAFKRATGAPPAAWRKERLKAGAQNDVRRSG